MEERLVVVVGYDQATLLDIACVTTSLEMANELGARPAYQVSLATTGGGAIICDAGLRLDGQRSLERITGPLDTLIVSGGIGHRAAARDPSIVAHVRRLAGVSRRVASVCTGASILAATGLLDGKRATTHWSYARQLADRHPTIAVDPQPIYIREGNVSTAAGVTSALDLTLAFVEEDHGAELARQVARWLVTYLQRPGNQAQMSMFISAPPPGHDLVRRLVEHIGDNLGGDLSTARLSAMAGVSDRHLTRLFLDQLGCTPGRYVRQARAEAAAHLLSTTTVPIARVAVRCGFSSAETLRQAFVTQYGLPPSRYRSASKAV